MTSTDHVVDRRAATLIGVLFIVGTVARRARSATPGESGRRGFRLLRANQCPSPRLAAPLAAAELVATA
jgi:hypothetical protein